MGRINEVIAQSLGKCLTSEVDPSGQSPSPSSLPPPPGFARSVTSASYDVTGFPDSYNVGDDSWSKYLFEP